VSEKMPSYQGRQSNNVLRTFLQQQQIGVMTFDQPRDILGTSAHPAQEIPADHPQPAIVVVTVKARDHAV
jgi:hypothetical protein